MGETHRHYLRDLGELLREKGQQAARAQLSARRRGFEMGRAMAFHEVLDLMLQQAKAFGIPASQLSLEGFNPDTLLVGTESKGEREAVAPAPTAASIPPVTLAHVIASSGSNFVHFRTSSGSRDLEAVPANVRVFRMTGSDFIDDEHLFGALSRALDFPDYFGWNWNAVLDCLRDLPDRFLNESLVLVVEQAEVAWAFPMVAGWLVEAWQEAASDFALQRRGTSERMHLVFLVSP